MFLCWPGRSGSRGNWPAEPALAGWNSHGRIGQGLTPSSSVKEVISEPILICLNACVSLLAFTAEEIGRLNLLWQPETTTEELDRGLPPPCQGFKRWYPSRSCFYPNTNAPDYGCILDMPFKLHWSNKPQSNHRLTQSSHKLTQTNSSEPQKNNFKCYRIDIRADLDCFNRNMQFLKCQLNKSS